jgi:hypothetical protein
VSGLAKRLLALIGALDELYTRLDNACSRGPRIEAEIALDDRAARAMLVELDVRLPGWR